MSRSQASGRAAGDRAAARARCSRHWPQAHYNYRQADVRQMLSLLDEAIADLRAATGDARFDLTLVAVAEPPSLVREPLLPPPTPKETIEQIADGGAAEPTRRPSGRRFSATALAGLDARCVGGCPPSGPTTRSPRRRRASTPRCARSIVVPGPDGQRLIGARDGSGRAPPTSAALQRLTRRFAPRDDGAGRSAPRRVTPSLPP